MFCQKCGNTLPDGSGFCSYCGAQFGQPQNGGIINSQAGYQQVQYGRQQYDQSYQQAQYGQQYQQPQYDQQAYDPYGGYGVQADGTAAVVKKKSPVVPILIVLLVLLIGGIGFLLVNLIGGKGRKLEKAIDNIFEAKSWTAELEGSYEFEDESYSSGDSVKIEVESYTDGKENNIFSVDVSAEGDSMVIAYYDEDLYVQAGGETEKLTDEEFADEKDYKQAMKAIDELAKRDPVAAAKAYDEIDEELKEVCKNYDEVLDISKKMLSDFYKNGKKADYIDDYEEDGNTFIFTINPRESLKAAKSDYGLEIDKDVYDELMEELKEQSFKTKIEFTIDGKYMSEIKVKLTSDDGTVVTGSIEFDDYNKIKPEDSKAADVAKDYKKNGGSSGGSVGGYAGKSQLKTANSNAKTAYNAAAENFADAETRGYPLDEVLAWYSYSDSEDFFIEDDKVYDASVHQSDKGAEKIASVLRENDDDAGYFKVCREYINGTETFVVYWAKDLSTPMVGQYPNAVTWEQYEDESYPPTIDSIYYGYYGDYDW